MEECSICLESMETDIILLKCLHHFHTKCITDHIFKHKKHLCPICRCPALYLNRCDIKIDKNNEIVYSKHKPKVSCCNIM